MIPQQSRRAVHPAQSTMPRQRRSAWNKRAIGLWLAFIGIVTSGVVFTIGGFNFAFERVLGLALVAVLIYRLIGPCIPSVKPMLWVWLGWWTVLCVSTIASRNVAPHLPPLLIAIVPIAYFAFIAGERLDAVIVDRIVRILLWIMGIAGVVSIASFRVLGPNRLPLDLVDEFGRVKLTVIEPNLLGSTLGFLILLSLPRARWNWSGIAMYFLAGVTLVGSFSKAPLAALIISLVLFGLFRGIARRASLTMALVLPVWLVGMGGVILLTLLPSVTDIYDRVLARDDAIISRSYFLRLAMQRFWESPLIGRGPGDFGLQNKALLWAVGGQDGNNLWIAQMMVNILHDSGIIGLLIYLLFLSLLLQQGLRWIKAGSLDHCGYVAAFISILISSQASTVHLNAIFGIAAGLIVALPRLSPIRRAQVPAQASTIGMTSPQGTDA